MTTPQVDPTMTNRKWRCPRLVHHFFRQSAIACLTITIFAVIATRWSSYRCGVWSPVAAVIIDIDGHGWLLHGVSVNTGNWGADFGATPDTNDVWKKKTFLGVVLSQAAYPRLSSRSVGVKHWLTLTLCSIAFWLSRLLRSDSPGEVD